MEQVLQHEFFDPLIKYILHVRRVVGYIEFTIPPNLFIDTEQVLKYFDHDVVLQYERGEPGILRGTITDKHVFTYLVKKFQKL
jgi:hypothetical protein